MQEQQPPNSQRHVKWLLRAFDRNTSMLTEEIPLGDNVTLQAMQKLFGASPDNPMYDAYPVSPREARVLAEFVADGRNLQLDHFDYFLECEAA